MGRGVSIWALWCCLVVEFERSGRKGMVYERMDKQMNACVLFMWLKGLDGMV